MHIVVVCLLLLGVGTTHAAPKPKPKAAALTPELTKFASEMAKAFDMVFAQVAVAKQHEAASKFAEAGAAWRGVYEGAKLLAQQVDRAAAAGAFQDPMTFSTKAGKLTVATYRTQLGKLQATGDVGWAKAANAEEAARAKQARITYVAAIATQVTSLETIAKAAASASKREPEAARAALQNVARGAGALRTSVSNAVKLKRAPSNATYPVKPKALSSSELAARLGQLEKAARTELAAIDKVLAARPKPAAANARPTTTASRTPAGGAPTQTPGAGQAADEPMAADKPDAPACSPQGDTHCDDTNMHAPCCEGSRCLPAGWVTNGTDAENFPIVEPEYYACQDPDLAPKR